MTNGEIENTVNCIFAETFDSVYSREIATGITDDVIKALEDTADADEDGDYSESQIRYAIGFAIRNLINEKSKIRDSSKFISFLQKENTELTKRSGELAEKNIELMKSMIEIMKKSEK